MSTENRRSDAWLDVVEVLSDELDCSSEKAEKLLIAFFNVFVLSARDYRLETERFFGILFKERTRVR